MPVIIGTTGIVNKGLETSGNNKRKASNRLCTKNNCARDIKFEKV
jgi:hypothetical protein